VSIIAPAYNEELSIVECIKSLLTIYYPKLELIIVNDGSRDNTFQLMVDEFELVRVDMAVDNKIETEKVYGIYSSANSTYSNLTVIDKENGGKADALNAGINVSHSDLFLSVDVDSIVEPDAILKMVKPFIEEEDGKEVIASGGVIRIANSCEIMDGRMSEVHYPKNFWARFQVVEYFRAFTLGRMAWSKINGLLIISGAFGLFDRERVKKIGGYDTSTVGEDMELVVRLRRYMTDVEKKKYRVAFIPDPLCWTEAPATYRNLATQRNRWARGGIETLFKHRRMFFNPKYGMLGILSFPFWVFFEWLGPIIQTLGIIYFIVLLLTGIINWDVFLMLLSFVYSFALLFSIIAVYFESITYNKYRDKNYIGKTVLFSSLEMFIYQPLNVWFALKGNFDFLFRRKKGWGTMTRNGFESEYAEEI
jgi:cellulose synthase/poly-beta-1,6-N-acetylglucosamine synthase-like glycosyltransferase